MDNNITWALPINGSGGISNNAKIHCFVNDTSMCGRYTQNNACYDVIIDKKFILKHPHFACKTCYKKWKKELYLLSYQKKQAPTITAGAGEKH